ncbi:MAG: HAMP domain-containing histidine kinase [Bryobacterales bacterium]|nr:HAMP domain-containing histidine kinase [Bryobacterales bacterium]
MHRFPVPRQTLVPWLIVAFLAVLCTVMAVLQYHWTGQLSRAEADRLRENLHQGLERLSSEFNADISQVAGALTPPNNLVQQDGREAAYNRRYQRWRESGRHHDSIRRAGVAVPDGEDLKLLLLDPATQSYVDSLWPNDWAYVREHLRARMAPTANPPDPRALDHTTVIEYPRFVFEPGGPGDAPRRPREQDWLVVEYNDAYLKRTLIPDLLQRYVGNGAGAGFEHKVIDARDEPESGWDDSTRLFSIRYDMGFRGRPDFGFGGPGNGQKRQPRAGMERAMIPPNMGGRWQLLVRYKGGSLEQFVAQTRRRNLAVSGGILLLMLATVVVLVRVSRQAQSLAEQQMNFVAGVSHELRTPLTVIRTAAFNLKGRMSSNPAAVERYGNLIQQESERLSMIVEQVLQFASTNAGRAVREREPLSVARLMEDALAATRPVVESAGANLETKIADKLPMVMGDAVALQHAVQNLITNAVKYGTEGNNWIGVSACVLEGLPQQVEIRVADRGPGVPADEQAHIFEPFYRGKRAVQDQIRGTGLGLTLVKQIVQAHGGTIHVESKPMLGSEFVIRLPLAPLELQDEFAHTAGRG